MNKIYFLFNKYKWTYDKFFIKYKFYHQYILVLFGFIIGS